MATFGLDHCMLLNAWDEADHIWRATWFVGLILVSKLFTIAGSIVTNIRTSALGNCITFIAPASPLKHVFNRKKIMLRRIWSLQCSL